MSPHTHPHYFCRQQGVNTVCVCGYGCVCFAYVSTFPLRFFFMLAAFFLPFALCNTVCFSCRRTLLRFDAKKRVSWQGGCVDVAYVEIFWQFRGSLAFLYRGRGGRGGLGNWNAGKDTRKAYEIDTLAEWSLKRRERRRGGEEESVE